MNGADLSPYRESPQASFISRRQRAASLRRENSTLSRRRRHSSLYYQPQALFEAGRDGAGTGRDSASLPGYCLHNMLEAPPTKASPAFTLEQEGVNWHQRSTLKSIVGLF